MATSQFAAPLMVPIFRWFDANGDPLNGGKVYTYEAGTSTPLATYPTYDDALGGTNANANPVVLDSAGAAQIWLQASFYKVVVKDSADVTLYTQDDVGSALGFPQPYPDQWIKETAAVTYVSATSFSVPGTGAAYHAGRRVKTTNSGGTVYGEVKSISGSSPCTITITTDSGSLDSGLSEVWYGWISYNSTSYLSPRNCFTAYKSGDMTGFGSATKVTTWSSLADPWSQWDNANNRFTAHFTGYYMVEAQVEFSDTGTNVAVTPYIYVNGSPVTQAASRSHGTANNITSAHLHWVGSVTNGQHIEIYVLGSANTTVKGTTGTRLSVVRVP